MADTFSEVARVGFGSNLAGSIKGVLLGVLLFLGSFAVLWNNEGRVDLSLVAKKSISTDSNKVDPATEGKFVSVTGQVKLTELVGDPQFLKPGPYLNLQRKVEMYAWVEHKETKTEKKTGGGSVETTEYRYTKEWTDSPAESSGFRYPKDHENPLLPVHEKIFTAANTHVGVYLFHPTDAELPSGEILRLDPSQLVDDPSSSTQLADDTYLFIGNGTMSAPLVGDTKIHFVALTPEGTYTLLGEQHSGEIKNFHDAKEDVSLFRLFKGDRNQAISTLATEHKIMTWVLRILGFFMMWFGLILFLAPLNTVLDIIPFLGSAGRLLTGLVLFPISIALSLLTILLSIIAHNIIVLLIVLSALAGGVAWQYQTAKKKKQQQSSQ